MSDQTPRDPIDELRRVNPTRVDQLPTSSRDRLWSRIEEARMAEDTTTTRTRLPRWALALSGVAMAAVAVAAVLLGGLGQTGPNPGPGIGSCVEQYSLDTLPGRAFAFDGTVTAIDGDQVTFAVNAAFWGVSGDSVTLTAGPGMTGDAITSAGGPNLAVAERYLVAGDDVFAWSCGFTQEYDPATAADWAAAAP